MNLDSNPSPEQMNGPGLGNYSVQSPTTNPVQPSGREETFATGEQEKEIVPSRWDQLKAILQQTSDKSPIGLAGFGDEDPGYLIRRNYNNRIEEDNRAAGVLKISPEEANKRYPDMPVHFNEPIDPYVADIQYSAFKHRQSVEAWKDRGTPLPWGVEGLTSMVAGATMDPLGFALTAFGGVGSKLLGLKSTVGSVFAQNLAINSALAVPQYLQEKSEHQNVSVVDSAIGAIQGAAIGTGLHFVVAPGISKTAESIKTLYSALGLGSKEVRGMPTELKAEAIKAAIDQHEAGANIEVTPVIAQAKARANGEMNGEASPYRFTPSQNASDRTFYSARDGQGNGVPFHELGSGTSLVDDGMVANNLGERVGQHEIAAETKLLDLEQPASSTVDKELITELEAKTGIKLDITPDETIKEVLTRLADQAANGEAPHDILDTVQEIAKAQGFDGYKGVIGSAEEGTQKNLVHLFDDKTMPSQAFESNKELIPSQTADQKSEFNKQSTAPEASAYYSPEVDKQIRDFKHGQPLNAQPEYMDSFVKEMIDNNLQKLQERAKLDPDLHEELQQIKRDNVTEQQANQATQDFADCVVDSL